MGNSSKKNLSNSTHD